MVSVSSNNNGATPLRVAVIGCGPGGMFVCHHVHERRRALLAQGLTEQAAQLPIVTVFEQADAPGGNWRADRVTQESLWTNGPKELTEFFDYTFDDHYGTGTPLPAYLPRAAMLDYMVGRVTRHAPNLLQECVQYQKKVMRVDYDDASQTFEIETQHVQTQERATHTFDRCVWAAGEAAEPKKPKPLLGALKHFSRGSILHSSELTDWATHVTNKHVLLVGASFSAEDIALTALKRGASKVTIVVRRIDPHAPVLWPRRWPDGVELVLRRVPVAVHPETQAIVCAPWDLDNHGPLPNRDTSNDLEIANVDTVVLCTGYDENYDMLDNAEMTEWDAEEDPGYDQDNTLQVPDDFQIACDDDKPYAQEVHAMLAHVPTPKELEISELVSTELHHSCIYAYNPHLFYICSEDFDYHLLAVDILSYLIVSVVMGETVVPSRNDICQRNRQVALEALQHPYVRFFLDKTYATELRRAMERHGETALLPGDKRLYKDYGDFFLRLLAQAAHDCHYPVDLGTWDGGLSETGLALVDMEDDARNLNWERDPHVTFRDLTAECCAQKLQSIHTGNHPLPFKQPWLELDDYCSPTEMVVVAPAAGADKLPQKVTSSKNDEEKKVPNQ